jgi:hypothetical protein
VIGPALARGAVVISDSICFKNLVRTLLPRQMDGGLAAAVDGLLAGVHVALSCRYLQPDVGLLLDADPATTARWRLAQHGGLEPGADLAVAGRPWYESFVTLQAELAARLRSAAEQWGWHVLPVDGRPLDQTVAAALELVTASCP